MMCNKHRAYTVMVCDGIIDQGDAVSDFVRLAACSCELPTCYQKAGQQGMN